MGLMPSELLDMRYGLKCYYRHNYKHYLYLSYLKIRCILTNVPNSYFFSTSFYLFPWHTTYPHTLLSSPLYIISPNKTKATYAKSETINLHHQIRQLPVTRLWTVTRIRYSAIRTTSFWMLRQVAESNNGSEEFAGF